MKIPTALETLTALNARQTDAAARRLGIAIDQRDEAHQRLAMLQQLRSEYEHTLQQKSGEGLSFADYRNFQAFLLKIDDAVRGQQQIVSRSVAHADDARAQWQEHQREGMSWKILSSRADQAALVKAAKQERKLTDEFAARAVMRTSETN